LAFGDSAAALEKSGWTTLLAAALALADSAAVLE
jgi:hypothetical protein